MPISAPQLVVVPGCLHYLKLTLPAIQAYPSGPLSVAEQEKRTHYYEALRASQAAGTWVSPLHAEDPYQLVAHLEHAVAQASGEPMSVVLPFPLPPALGWAIADFHKKQQAKSPAPFIHYCYEPTAKRLRAHGLPSERPLPAFLQPTALAALSDQVRKVWVSDALLGALLRRVANLPFKDAKSKVAVLFPRGTVLLLSQNPVDNPTLEAKLGLPAFLVRHGLQCALQDEDFDLFSSTCHSPDRAERLGFTDELTQEALDEAIPMQAKPPCAPLPEAGGSQPQHVSTVPSRALEKFLCEDQDSVERKRFSFIEIEQMRRNLLIEGPSGVGKDTAVRAAAQHQDKKLVHVNAAQGADFERIVKKVESALHAWGEMDFHRGARPYVLLSEANLLDECQLRRMSDLCKSGFGGTYRMKLIMTVNPSEAFPGRRPFPPSLREHFSCYEVPDYEDQDFMALAEHFLREAKQARGLCRSEEPPLLTDYEHQVIAFYVAYFLKLRSEVTSGLSVPSSRQLRYAMEALADTLAPVAEMSEGTAPSYQPVLFFPGMDFEALKAKVWQEHQAHPDVQYELLISPEVPVQPDALSALNKIFDDVHHGHSAPFARVRLLYPRPADLPPDVLNRLVPAQDEGLCVAPPAASEPSDAAQARPLPCHKARKLLEATSIQFQMLPQKVQAALRESNPPKLAWDEHRNDPRWVDIKRIVGDRAIVFSSTPGCVRFENGKVTVDHALPVQYVKQLSVQERYVCDLAQLFAVFTHPAPLPPAVVFDRHARKTSYEPEQSVIRCPFDQSPDAAVVCRALMYAVCGEPDQASASLMSEAPNWKKDPVFSMFLIRYAMRYFLFEKNKRLNVNTSLAPFFLGQSRFEAYLNFFGQTFLYHSFSGLSLIPRAIPGLVSSSGHGLGSICLSNTYFLEKMREDCWRPLQAICPRETGLAFLFVTPWGKTFRFPEEETRAGVCPDELGMHLMIDGVLQDAPRLKGDLEGGLSQQGLDLLKAVGLHTFKTEAQRSMHGKGSSEQRSMHGKGFAQTTTKTHHAQPGSGRLNVREQVLDPSLQGGAAERQPLPYSDRPCSDCMNGDHEDGRVFLPFLYPVCRGLKLEGDFIPGDRIGELLHVDADGMVYWNEAKKRPQSFEASFANDPRCYARGPEASSGTRLKASVVEALTPWFKAHLGAPSKPEAAGGADAMDDLPNGEGFTEPHRAILRVMNNFPAPSSRLPKTEPTAEQVTALVRALERFFTAFTSEDLGAVLTQEGGGASGSDPSWAQEVALFTACFKEMKGHCQHLSLIAYFILSYLGVPCRRVQDQHHRWVEYEVKDPEGKSLWRPLKTGQYRLSKKRDVRAFRARLNETTPLTQAEFSDERMHPDCKAYAASLGDLLKQAPSHEQLSQLEANGFLSFPSVQATILKKIVQSTECGKPYEVCEALCKKIGEKVFKDLVKVVMPSRVLAHPQAWLQEKTLEDVLRAGASHWAYDLYRAIPLDALIGFFKSKVSSMQAGNQSGSGFDFLRHFYSFFKNHHAQPEASSKALLDAWLEAARYAKPVSDSTSELHHVVIPASMKACVRGILSTLCTFMTQTETHCGVAVTQFNPNASLSIPYHEGMTPVHLKALLDGWRDVLCDYPLPRDAACWTVRLETDCGYVSIFMRDRDQVQYPVLSTKMKSLSDRSAESLQFIQGEQGRQFPKRVPRQAMVHLLEQETGVEEPPSEWEDTLDRLEEEAGGVPEGMHRYSGHDNTYFGQALMAWPLEGLLFDRDLVEILRRHDGLSRLVSAFDWEGLDQCGFTYAGINYQDDEGYKKTEEFEPLMEALWDCIRDDRSLWCAEAWTAEALKQYAEDHPATIFTFFHQEAVRDVLVKHFDLEAFERYEAFSSGDAQEACSAFSGASASSSSDGGASAKKHNLEEKETSEAKRPRLGAQKESGGCFTLYQLICAQFLVKRIIKQFQQRHTPRLSVTEKRCDALRASILAQLDAAPPEGNEVHVSHARLAITNDWLQGAENIARVKAALQDFALKDQEGSSAGVFSQKCGADRESGGTHLALEVCMMLLGMSQHPVSAPCDPRAQAQASLPSEAAPPSPSPSKR
jgi:hypothetical protein